MSVTVSRLTQPEPVGSRFEGLFTVAFGTGYPTGGELVAPANFGFLVLEYLEILADNPGSAVKRVVYDHTNKKLKVLVETTGTFAEAANASDQTGVSVVVKARGA